MILNALTGESQLEGTDYHFIFTAEAFVRAEKQLGIGTIELLDKAVNGRGGIHETGVLLACGIEAWRRRNNPAGKPFRMAGVTDLMTKAGGFMKVQPQVSTSMLASPALGLRNVEGAEEDEVDEGDEDDADPFDGTTSSPEPSKQE